LKEVFASVQYLDNITTDPQDYIQTLQTLSSIYGKDKSYNFGMFADLTHDGKDFVK
jgi:hypothetical protein